MVSAVEVAASCSLAGVAAENRACLPAGRARRSDGREGTGSPCRSLPTPTSCSSLPATRASTGIQYRARFPSGSGAPATYPMVPATTLVSSSVRASSR